MADLPVVIVSRRKKSPARALVYVSGTNLQVRAVRVYFQHCETATGQRFKIIATVTAEQPKDLEVSHG